MNTAVGSIVPAFRKELICKVLRPLAPLLELSRLGILLDDLGVGQVSWLDDPKTLVSSLTLDSAKGPVICKCISYTKEASSKPNVSVGWQHKT
ncbi:hypothetical protein Tco_0669714 [Tanacetum coccineum]